MKMEDLEKHVKKAFTKIEKKESEEQVKEASETIEAPNLDLFGYPIEEAEDLNKKAVKCSTEEESDNPQKVKQPECEESFSAKNENKKGDDPEVGDSGEGKSKDDVQGKGEGPEY